MPQSHSEEYVDSSPCRPPASAAQCPRKAWGLRRAFSNCCRARGTSGGQNLSPSLSVPGSQPHRRRRRVHPESLENRAVLAVRAGPGNLPVSPAVALVHHPLQNLEPEGLKG